MATQEDLKTNEKNDLKDKYLNDLIEAYVHLRDIGTGRESILEELVLASIFDEHVRRGDNKDDIDLDTELKILEKKFQYTENKPNLDTLFKKIIDDIRLKKVVRYVKLPVIVEPENSIIMESINDYIENALEETLIESEKETLLGKLRSFIEEGRIVYAEIDFENALVKFASPDDFFKTHISLIEEKIVHNGKKITEADLIILVLKKFAQELA